MGHEFKTDGKKLIRCSARHKFGGNNYTEEVVVPSEVEVIGARAFYQCAFGGITLPDGLKEIEDYAFDRATSKENKNRYACGEYLGSVENPHMVLIDAAPDKEGTIEVHSDTRFIDADAFKEERWWYPEVKKIVFGDKLEFIGKDAFSHSAVMSLFFPDSVKRIGAEAFLECGKLESAKLPAYLETIENGLFYKCAALTTVEFPKQLKEIGISAFHGCVSLKEALLPKGVYRLGKRAFRSCEALERVTLSVGLKEIPEEAFFGCKKLAAVELPEGLRAIGKDAFDGCESIVTLVIPSSVTEIDGCPFNHCSSLKSITVADGNQSYFMRGNALIEKATSRPVWQGADGEEEFYEAGSGKTVIGREEHKDNLYLKNVLIADGVKEIDVCAFSGCTSLECVELPKGLKKICSEAFANCMSLKKVVFPKSLTEVGWDVFSDCTALESVVFEGEMPPDNAGMFDGCRSLKEVTIPAATELCGRAFASCESLESITLPEGLKNVWHKVFENCVSLKRIVMPATVEYIGDRAFAGCTALQEVVIEGADVALGHDAFNGCGSLKSIDLTRGVTLRSNVFGNCKNLKTILLAEDDPKYYVKDGGLFRREGDVLIWLPEGTDIPKGTKKIGDRLFADREDLKKFTVPDGVEEILDGAFACSGLTEITLPASIKFIDLYAFEECKELRTIYFKGTRAEWHGVDIDDKSYYHEDSDWWNLVNATIYSSFTVVKCTDGDDN